MSDSVPVKNRLVPELVQVKSAWFLGNDAHLKLSVEVNYIIHDSYSFVTVSYPPVLTATYWFHIIRVPIRSPASHQQFSLSLSGGFTPSRHLRPSSGREHTIVQLIQSGGHQFISFDCYQLTIF